MIAREWRAAGRGREQRGRRRGRAVLFLQLIQMRGLADHGRVELRRLYLRGGLVDRHRLEAGRGRRGRRRRAIVLLGEFTKIHIRERRAQFLQICKGNARRLVDCSLPRSTHRTRAGRDLETCAVRR